MEYFDKLIQIFVDNPDLATRPWWVYAIAAMIPACMILAFREFCCWFWKLNKLVGRLDRIEKKLKALDPVTQPVQQPAAQRTPSKQDVRPAPSVKSGDTGSFKLE